MKNIFGLLCLLFLSSCLRREGLCTCYQRNSIKVVRSFGFKEDRHDPIVGHECDQYQKEHNSALTKQAQQLIYVADSQYIDCVYELE